MEDRCTLHASCVDVDGRAALIRGASGSGKSALALQIMAMGGLLVADDRVLLTREGGEIIAHEPQVRPGQIEARGIGILNVPSVTRAPVGLIVDLTQPEVARLPEWHKDQILGITLPTLRKTDAPHFPAAIMMYLRGSRVD